MLCYIEEQEEERKIEKETKKYWNMTKKKCKMYKSWLKTLSRDSYTEKIGTQGGCVWRFQELALRFKIQLFITAKHYVDSRSHDSEKNIILPTFIFMLQHLSLIVLWVVKNYSWKVHSTFQV